MKRPLKILLALFLFSQPVLAGGIGVGVSVGREYPIIQEDQKEGQVIGIRARLQAPLGLSFEPNIYFTHFGDPDFDDFTSDLEGSKVTAYGVDLLFGGAFGAIGFKPYYLAGVGVYNTSRDQSLQDEQRIGWSTGLGLEFGVAKFLSLDFRARAVIVPTQGGGSKKSASLTGGMNLYF